MKLEDKVGNVTITPGIKITNFRLKVNKHSFKQLYSGLYSDKVHAIIRELATNAADSHISAGKADVPFEVHLPNDLEPFFYIKDFGTGLSPEQIDGENGIYITFFESDKAHSDDFTGCLGLGSKSPFAYTDNFMVESRYNGKVYSYVCLHNEAGEPCIAPMGVADTTEPNGLKVEFAVKQADFYQFHGKAEEVLSWFKVKPNVFGKEFKFKETKYLRSTDRYGVHAEREGHSYVVMGNVAYQVNASDFSYSKLDDVERQVVEWGVDLFVDIGDVEFVPSREKLAMTDKTITGVKKYLKGAIKSLQEELEIQITSQKTIWQARRMLYDIKYSILGKVRSMTTIMYNGKELYEYVTVNKYYDKKEIVVDGQTLPAPKPKTEAFSLRKDHYKRADESVIFCDKSPIFINDLEHGGYARITKQLRDNGDSKGYCLSGPALTTEFLTETGIGEVAIKTSTLPKIERQKRERVVGEVNYVKRTVVQEYNLNGGSYAGNWWKDVEVDLEDGGVYVMVSYGQVMDSEDYKIAPRDISFKFKAIKGLNPDFKLLAIRPSHVAKIEKHKDKWIKLQDYINNLVKEKAVLAERALAALQYEEVSNKERYEPFDSGNFESHSLFGNFLDTLAHGKKCAADGEVDAYVDLNRHATDKCETLSDKEAMEKVRGQIEETYPLLNMLDWWGISQEGFTSNVGEYIRAMDDRRLDGVISRPSAKEAHLEEAV